MSNDKISGFLTTAELKIGSHDGGGNFTWIDCKVEIDTRNDRPYRAYDDQGNEVRAETKQAAVLALFAVRLGATDALREALAALDHGL